MSYHDWLNSTLASDACEGRGVLPFQISQLVPGTVISGPAFVISASQDDNLSVNQALAAGFPEGCVLVVAGHETSRGATIGGLMALEILNQGVKGLITDGLVRDAQEIRDLPLPVWCRGTTPTAPLKKGPGHFGGSVVIGGVVVYEGDLVIADADGVVVWPKAEIPTLLEKAKARLDSDNARLAKLLIVAAERKAAGK